MLGPDPGSGVMPVDVKSPGQEHNSHDQERDERENLDQRRPELQLAEPGDRDHVHRQHHHQGDERKKPLRDRPEGRPVVQVGGDCGGVHDRCHRPVQEIHPAHGVGGLLAEEFPRVGHERARRRTVQHQLAQRTQDEEHEDPADAVYQEQPGPGLDEAPAGAEEQTGADRAADRDHLKLPGLEAFVVAGFFVESRSAPRFPDAGQGGRTGRPWRVQSSSFVQPTGMPRSG